MTLPKELHQFPYNLLTIYLTLLPHLNPFHRTMYYCQTDVLKSPFLICHLSTQEITMAVSHYAVIWALFSFLLPFCIK